MSDRNTELEVEPELWKAVPLWEVKLIFPPKLHAYSEVSTVPLLWPQVLFSDPWP